MMKPNDEDHAPAAGLGVRAAALLIDLMVLFFLHVGSSLFVGATLFQMLTVNLQQILGASLLYILFLLIAPPILAMVYFIILHGFGGQTIGKLILGLRVVSTTGTTISSGVAFLRWVGALISTLPLAMGFLWAIFDREHCTWHDKLSGTRVIATRKILTSV